MLKLIPFIKYMKLYYSIILFLVTSNIFAGEMIIGRENISPGINLVFEGAPKDTIYPQKSFRLESDTDLHIEMLANWSKKAPKGSPIGGFVAYLKVIATIESANGKIIQVELTPHLNITDNLHYAQNIKLPGRIDELYKVTFTIYPPKNNELGIHYDWKEGIGPLISKTTFDYYNLDFEDIALSSRR